MNFHRISIIPIELFSRENANSSVDIIISIFNLENYTKSYLFNVINEICGKNSTVIKVDKNVHIIKYETSICLVLEEEKVNWKDTFENVRSELIARNLLHKGIINENYIINHNISIGSLIKDLNTKKYPNPIINYVYTFYVIESESTFMNYKNQVLLSEPSIIDLDDMMSTNVSDNQHFNYDKLDIPKLEDIDSSNNSRTLITWESMVCSSKKNAIETKGLLIALECRLQMTWNKCFSISELIDNIFSDERRLKNTNELYWNFVKALDDAKSVISSTFSSRAANLFYQMVKTSKVDGELNRLDQKIHLVE